MWPKRSLQMASRAQGSGSSPLPSPLARRPLKGVVCQPWGDNPGGKGTAEVGRQGCYPRHPTEAGASPHPRKMGREKGRVRGRQRERGGRERERGRGRKEGRGREWKGNI